MIVEHNYMSELIHICCLIDYFEKEDTVLQLNYSSEFYARQDVHNTTVGMWKIKNKPPCNQPTNN